MGKTYIMMEAVEAGAKLFFQRIELFSNLSSTNSGDERGLSPLFPNRKFEGSELGSEVAAEADPSVDSIALQRHTRRFNIRAKAPPLCCLLTGKGVDAV